MIALVWDSSGLADAARLCHKRFWPAVAPICDIYDVHRDRVSKLLLKNSGGIQLTARHEDVLIRK